MTPVRAATGVYFIKGADVVKIGVALCVRDRLRVLQVGSPVPLTPLGFIRCDFRKSFAKERELHALFAALRKHNEWFSDSPDLRAYIRDNAEPWPE